MENEYCEGSGTIVTEHRNDKSCDTCFNYE